MVSLHQADLTKDEECEVFVQKAIENMGELDVGIGSNFQSKRGLKGLSFWGFCKSSMAQKSSLSIGPALKSFSQNFNDSMFLTIPSAVVKAL